MMIYWVYKRESGMKISDNIMYSRNLSAPHKIRHSKIPRVHYTIIYELLTDTRNREDVFTWNFCISFG